MKTFIYRYSNHPHQSNKRNFYFVNEDKRKISLDSNTKAYVDSLKLPPAYHPVKINLNKNSKVLAIGVDKKGKDQYMYNPKWIEERQELKYCQLKDFAVQLPSIKGKIAKDLTSPGITLDKMIAVILRIILVCHFRIGNDIGRDVYNSYGITTITKKQIDIKNNSTAKIKFIGKRGVLNQCIMKDDKVISILRHLYNDRKGEEALFTYKEGAQKHRVNAKDVNNYLKNFGDFTTKYFRTWVANIEFIDEIMNRYHIKESLSETARKKLLRECVVATAVKLHHTPAICKKSYISKDLWDLFSDTPEKFDKIIVKHYKSNSVLDASENAFINFLNTVC
jgi:DNA topoisomerase-1